jgi:hypothetical protein
MVKEIAYNSKADASVNHGGVSDRDETVRFVGFHWNDWGLGTLITTYRYFISPERTTRQSLPLSMPADQVPK